MSVRMKLTHGKTASRRAHHKKSAPQLVKTETGVRRRHFADLDTGMYRGKQILNQGKHKQVKKESAKVSKEEKTASKDEAKK